MSERKVLNKYFPPDFDPSKIKRRKRQGPKNSQITVTLKAPYTMRCTKCGEYICKYPSPSQLPFTYLQANTSDHGRKFNARKETAEGEEYLGVKVFRFYIKCTLCSQEITFKTDPKNADFTPEHGATRTFDNWSEADPEGRAGALPTAAEDDEDDPEREACDAMAELERSQEASRREMEIMDELADLRSRNARVDTSKVGDDPEALLAKLHEGRLSREEEERRTKEAEEDDAEVAKYFTKMAPPPLPLGGKGKEKAKDDSPDGEKDGSEEAEEKPKGPTIKRAVTAAGEPSVAAILAAKGKAAEPVAPPAPAQVKRKREGMQKLLGIKKKAKA